MKNEQKKTKPFSLAKETIVRLNSLQLKEIKGGAPTVRTSSAAEGNQSSLGTSYNTCDSRMCESVFQSGLNFNSVVKSN